MFLLLFICVFKCLCHVIIIFIQRYIDVFFMVKNHIFFYIHKVMIFFVLHFGDASEERDVLITCVVCAVLVTVHLNILCFPFDCYC